MGQDPRKGRAKLDEEGGSDLRQEPLRKTISNAGDRGNQSFDAAGARKRR